MKKKILFIIMFSALLLAACQRSYADTLPKASQARVRLPVIKPAEQAAPTPTPELCTVTGNWYLRENHEPESEIVGTVYGPQVLPVIDKDTAEDQGLWFFVSITGSNDGWINSRACQ